MAGEKRRLNNGHAAANKVVFRAGAHVSKMNLVAMKTPGVGANIAKMVMVQYLTWQVKSLQALVLIVGEDSIVAN